MLAGATVYLKSRYGEKTDKHYFRYYDNVLIEIDGIQYDGIILDSCGACSYVQENRLDLFVRDKDSVIDRGYKGKNMIKVVYKRLIIASIETDGHSGTSVFLTTNEKSYNEAIRSLLYYEDELIYHFSHENKIDDNVIEQWYDGDLGEMSIMVKTFNTIKEIENKEFYTRTG